MTALHQIKKISKQRRTSPQLEIALFCLKRGCYDFRMVLLASIINFPWQAFFCSQVRSAPSLKSPTTGLYMGDLAAAEPLKIHLPPDTLEGRREVRPRSGLLDEVAVTAGVEVVVVAVAEGGGDAALAGTTWATPSLPVPLALELDF